MEECKDYKVLLQLGVSKEIVSLCSGDSLLMSDWSSECRESWDGAVGTWLGTESYRILPQRWERNGQWRAVTWSRLEIGFLRSGGIGLFSYCLVSLEESRSIECVSFKNGAGVTSRKLGALSLTSWSAVAVSYLGQVCFPLSACLSSCVT